MSSSDFLSDDIKNSVNKSSSNSQKSWKSDDFEVGRVLGNGRFGEVILASVKNSEFIVALKIINKEQAKNDNYTLQVKREILYQHYCRHPNILRLYGFFDDAKKVYMVLEYARNGSLSEFLKEKKKLAANQACYMMEQLAGAVAYLHEKSVIHRDIKPENILLFKDDVPKLGDFGLSVHGPSSKRIGVCGTLDYLAPEVVACSEDNPIPHDHKIDNWSLGVVFFEMLQGFTPFYDEDPNKTWEKIKSCEETIEKFKDLFEEAQALEAILHLMDAEPFKRMEMKDWQQLPWIRSLTVCYKGKLGKDTVANKKKSQKENCKNVLIDFSSE